MKLQLIKLNVILIFKICNILKEVLEISFGRSLRKFQNRHTVIESYLLFPSLEESILVDRKNVKEGIRNGRGISEKGKIPAKAAEGAEASEKENVWQEVGGSVFFSYSLARGICMPN